ncbi:imidazole glycerol phosphate synthase subunit HisH [Hydrogenimonas thermophila]|uniref:Imidazole glycerol phosphate synthase subunit HisH n=1 Tax=Hydrogenimonas thermophila TaxID=223786 RepID=A0A1I5M6Y7_9BACT|nr:imidazole glycerol phosphate synthase subunit HisH [Hydrogenimonas thermophila]SFP05263.1 imidazole glycerol phosphate synthase subunit hisH [Hydrogenimonas thermophila]
MIAIIDYNMGNLASVQNALAKIGAESKVVSEPNDVKNYDKVLLPGVGAFGDAMEHLRQNGMDEAVKEFAKSGKPMLGICLGMQLLFSKSLEFGEHKGLNLIPGQVVPFNDNMFNKPHKVPHMGWNELFVQKDTPIFRNLPKEFYLYFVHSFHAVTTDEYAIGKTWYGYEFVSAVQNGNIFGIQPHPEKSHENGLEILSNFVQM